MHHGGLGPFELKGLRLLEEESCKLKQLVADLSLDKAMLQEVVRSAEKGNCCSQCTMGDGLRQRCTV